MGKITSLVAGKRDVNSVNVYIDGEYAVNIPLETVLEYGLVKGMELDDSMLALIDLGKDKAKAYRYLTESVSRHACSVKGIRDKLYAKGYPKYVVDETVERGIRVGLLDDRAYAESYIDINLNRKGAVRLRAELKSKGISDEIIDEYLTDTFEEELAAAIEFSRKFAENYDMADRKTAEKLIRKLQYKGYKWSVISRCLEGVDCKGEE